MNARVMLIAGCLFCVAAARAADPALENITSTRAARVDMAKRQYDAAVSAADRDAVQRLTQLLNARAASGNTAGAEAVREALATVQATGSLTTQADHAAKDIERRFLELHRALVAGDLDKAAKYIDPKNMNLVQPATAKALLGVWSTMLRVGQVGAADVKVERARMGVKGNESVVESRIHVHGKWDDQKPSYWVLREGEWYLGDEKEIANFK